MSKKSIQIDPALFNLSGGRRVGRKPKRTAEETQKKKEMMMNVSNKSVKDILLAKLKAYKKKKQNTMKRTLENDDSGQHHQQKINEDFLSKIKKRKQQTAKNVNLGTPQEFNVLPSTYQSTPTSINMNPTHFSSQISTQSVLNHDVQAPSVYDNNVGNIYIPDKPKYGILKNGSQPTIRTFRNTMKNLIHKKIPSPSNEQKIHLEIERKLNVGRNKTLKKCGIFIKSNLSKQETDTLKTELRKRPIKTVKNYLKKQNLIKYGSNAPQKLLREIYETSNLLGNVENKNSNVLVENFLEKEENIMI